MKRFKINEAGSKDWDLLQIIGYPFELKVHHNFKKLRNKYWYVCTYSVSPAYSPEEGGYYQDVIEFEWSEQYTSYADAKKALRELADDYDLIIGYKARKAFSNSGRYECTNIVGIETEWQQGQYERAFQPYC